MLRFAARLAILPLLFVVACTGGDDASDTILLRELDAGALGPRFEVIDPPVSRTLEVLELPTHMALVVRHLDGGICEVLVGEQDELIELAPCSADDGVLLTAYVRGDVVLTQVVGSAPGAAAGLDLSDPAPLCRDGCEESHDECQSDAGDESQLALCAQARQECLDRCRLIEMGVSQSYSSSK